MNEETPIQRQEIEVTTQTTACDHEWLLSPGESGNELVSLLCSKCPSGISVAPGNVSKYLKNGVLKGYNATD